MAESKYARIAKATRNKGAKGNVISKQYLDEAVRPLAILIKEFMFKELDESGKHKIRRDRSGIYHKTKIDFDADGVKINIPDYAQQLDTGRRAGVEKVPIAELIKWIKRYRIIGRDKGSGRFKSAGAKSINNMAYAMQTIIYKKGIKARPFLKNTLDYAEGLLVAAIEEIIVPDIISVIEFALPKSK